MEIISTPFTGSWRRYWRRRKYQRINGRNRKMKVLRIGDKRSPKRAWKIGKVVRLRILKIATSPLKLLGKLKSAYVNMMLNMAGNDSVFGNKRIPKARRVHTSACTVEEFETILVCEIFKAFKATL